MPLAPLDRIDLAYVNATRPEPSLLVKEPFTRAKSHSPPRCPCVTPEVVGQQAEKVVARSRDAPTNDEDLRVVSKARPSEYGPTVCPIPDA